MNEIIEVKNKNEKQNKNNIQLDNYYSNYLPILCNELNISKYFTEEENKNIKIFYDQITKRIIVITPYLIKIFNRTGEELKRELHYTSIETVIFAVVNKEINYLLLCSELNVNQRMIFCIKTESSNIILTINTGNYSSLLGMFFITQYNFCIICSNRIEYYFIDPNTEECFQKLNVKCNGRYLISNFYYCRQYYILIIERTDNSFDIYNLRNKDFYCDLVKNFSISFNEKKKKMHTRSKSKTFQTVTNFFSINKFNEKVEYDKIIKSLNNPNEKYKTSQYFLQILYTKLYFIYLSYDDKMIFIMKLKNLKTFPEESGGNKLFKIPYEAFIYNSTIQFVDNLILVYNFLKKEVLIIDLKYKDLNNPTNFILIRKLGVDFPFFDFINYQIYNKISLFEMINSNNEKKIFYLKFDLTNFIGHFFKKHEALIYLTRRGKSNIYILSVMKEMILNEELKVKKILWLINQFTELIKKNEEFAKKIISKTSNTKSNEKIGKDLMEIDLAYYMKSKKNNITQDKFLMHIFQGILNDEGLTNDHQCVKIMNYLLYFYYILKDKKEDNIISIFSDIFHGFYEEIEDKSNLISLFLNFKYLPKEKDLGLFLIKEKKNSFLQQLGINILLSKGFFNEIFDYIVKEEGINSGILFLQKYQKYITEPQIVIILKNYLNKNKYDQYTRHLLNLFLKTDVNVENNEEEENPYLQTVI